MDTLSALDTSHKAYITPNLNEIHHVVQTGSSGWMIMNGIFLSILFSTLIFSKNLGESARKKLGWGLGALSLLNFAASNLKMVIENSWHIENSLPLHLCGMSAFIAAFLLIRGSQISYEFLV